MDFPILLIKIMFIFDKHVDISRKNPEILSIDEHYFHDSNYDSLKKNILHSIPSIKETKKMNYYL